MATIKTIQATDQITNSRADINDNFSALNSDKIETSYLDTDSTLAANSDVKIPSQKAVKLYVDAGGSASNLERLLPVGSILPYGGSVAPSYFKLCDGTSYLRADYVALFAVIGTTFGSVDATHFNVPDLRSRLPLGVGTTPTKIATFASRSSNVITVTGLTNAANNEFQTGQAVLYSAPSGAMTGLTDNTTYYLIRTGNLTFSLATSLANAIAGTVISLSSDGTGTQTFTLTLTTRTLGDTGGEENHGLTTAELAAHTHGLTGNDSGAGVSRPDIQIRPTGITVQSDASGGSSLHNNLSPFLALNYIIKT